MVFGAWREAVSERGRWTEHKRTPTGRALPATSTGDLTTLCPQVWNKRLNSDLLQCPGRSWAVETWMHEWGEREGGGGWEQWRVTWAPGLSTPTPHFMACLEAAWSELDAGLCHLQMGSWWQHLSGISDEKGHFGQRGLNWNHFLKVECLYWPLPDAFRSRTRIKRILSP